MALSRTDGAASAGVDPSASDQWESVLNDGIAATGVDPNGSFEDASPPDPAAEPPQSSSGSSAEPSATPQPTAGDDGSGTRNAQDIGSAAAPPSPESQPDPNAVDPLAGALPFTFDVEGQARTVDGAYRIPGEGLYVPEDRVPEFQQQFQLAARADAQARELAERSAAWDRVTAWQVTTKGENGQPVTSTLTGQAGLEAARVYTATQTAKAIAYERTLNALMDPAKFQNFWQQVQGDDGQTYILPNKAAFDAELREANQFARESAFTARQRFAEIAAPPPPPAPTAADYAKPTIASLVDQHKITDLTDADREFLATEFPRYVVRDGQGKTAVDPRFLEVIKDRAALRAEQKRTAEAAGKVDKFNAGMNGNRRPAAPPRPVALPNPVTPPAKVGKAQQWDDVLQSALPDVLATMGQ